MSSKCRAKFEKYPPRPSKRCFCEFKLPVACPIPNIRGIKPDKWQIRLENRLPNSYIWNTIGLAS